MPLLQTGIHPRDCILSSRFDLRYSNLSLQFPLSFSLSLCLYLSVYRNLTRGTRDKPAIVISNLRTNDVAVDDCLHDRSADNTVPDAILKTIYRRNDANRDPSLLQSGHCSTRRTANEITDIGDLETRY